jgi:hypothetical protein
MEEARKTKTPQESGEPTKEDLDSFGEWPWNRKKTLKTWVKS